MAVSLRPVRTVRLRVIDARAISFDLQIGLCHDHLHLHLTGDQV
jgi:hypothetical protein